MSGTTDARRAGERSGSQCQPGMVNKPEKTKGAVGPPLPVDANWVD
jgi:hypothetical protein